MEKNARIYVAGGRTLIGAAILDELRSQGYKNLLGNPGEEPNWSQADQVDAFFGSQKPEYVFLAAGPSGGILANKKFPAILMRENLLINTHVIHSAYNHKVKKLLYLASSCCYPKYCPQPMKEDFLLTGPLEPTNEPYAIAKIAGIKLCQAYHQQFGANFIAAIPATAFGPGDDFNEEDSHVIPGLIRRMDEAKRKGARSLAIWGTGTVRREFIFVRDLADACIWVMKKYEEDLFINIGTGSDISIAELAQLIQELVGFQGKILFDEGKPDGMPRKLLDSRRVRGLGWEPRTPFRSALAATYQGFLNSRGFHP